MIRPRIAAALAAVGLAAGLALVPSTALAAAPSTIAFADLTPISTGFMGEWHAKLVVTVDDGGGLRPAPPAQGTVDVFVQGIPGPWMTGLPVGADGSVYVAQPIDQPFLPAGTHDISATYVPAAGGYVETSQTASPLVVTIAPLTVAGTVEIVPDEVTGSPVIQGTLGGSWVDELKGSPAGTWAFSVADAAGKVLFSAEAPVAQGTSDPAAVRCAARSIVPRASRSAGSCAAKGSASSRQRRSSSSRSCA